MKTRRLDPERLHADTQMLRLWVLMLACVVGDAFERLLNRDWRIVLRQIVRDLACDVRGLLIDIAVAQVNLPARRRRTLRPGSIPPGFRRPRQHMSAVRLFKRVVKLRGRSPGARLRWLRRVFATLKVWIARLLARFGALKGANRLVTVAPPAVTLAACAMVATMAADTS